MRHLAPALLLSAALVGSAATLPSATAATANDASATSGTVSAPALDPDPADRESMRRGWLEVLKPALDTPTGWRGNLAGCDAGTPSAAAQDATLTAVNYYRDLVGVEPVVLDDALSAKAQQAALMMAANGDLDHTPPSTWSCYSATGADAAGHSNLALGSSAAGSITGYLDDDGSGNTVAGHRRWIIDPRQTRIGSGSVQVPDGGWRQESNALYVIDSGSWQEVPAGTPAYLPWPVAGYVPRQIEPKGRWSLSASDSATDFSHATVTVDGSASGITVQPVANGYGPPTLVWDFDPGFADGDPDRAYDVVVSGIRTGGQTTSYSYTVTLFDAERAAPRPSPTPTPTPDPTPTPEPTTTPEPNDVTAPVVVPTVRAFQIVGIHGVGVLQWQVEDVSPTVQLQIRKVTRAYDAVGESVETGDWTPVPDGLTTWPEAGTTECSSARARDMAGNVSDWSPSTCVHSALDDAVLRSSKDWRVTRSARLWQGSAHTSTARGAVLRLPHVVDVTRLGLVATRCASCGKAELWVGRSYAGRVDLRAKSTRRQSVLTVPVTERSSVPLSGTVRVVVASTGRKVQVDGVIVGG